MLESVFLVVWALLATPFPCDANVCDFVWNDYGVVQYLVGTFPTHAACEDLRQHLRRQPGGMLSAWTPDSVWTIYNCEARGVWP